MKTKKQTTETTEQKLEAMQEQLDALTDLVKAQMEAMASFANTLRVLVDYLNLGEKPPAVQGETVYNDNSGVKQ